MEEKRIEWIDWLKGFCMILIVLGHVIRGFISAGMYEQIDLKYIDYTIYSFHMPLMFFISGFLYSITREEKLKDWKDFILDKIVKLYIPYLIFAYILFIFKTIFDSSINSETNMNNFITIPFMPFDIYWFLMALLLIFIVYSFMDYKKINNKLITSIGFISLIISFYIPSNYYIKLIFKYIGLGFYFYLGSYLTNKAISKKWIMPLLIGYIILNVVNYYFDLQICVIEIALALSMILILVIYAQNYKHNSKLLNKIGKQSMIIYLLHTFFTSFTRIVLIKINVTSFIIQLFLGVAMGICMPLLVYYLINKFKFLSWCKFAFYPKLNFIMKNNKAENEGKNKKEIVEFK